MISLSCPAVQGLLAQGRAAWPGLALDDADFVDFLGRILPEDAALPALHAGDLWLVCAYGRGVPGAADALDRCYLTRVRGALVRLGEPPMVEDVLQELRRRLVEMQHRRPEQKVYSGRGELLGWLRVSAVREMNRRRQRSGRELPLETVPIAPSPANDPEIALLRETEKRELRGAFHQALSSMSGRDRNVLRYHFAEGLTIDQIGALYQVHRATAARWVQRAREELCQRTWENLQHRLSISEDGFQRALGLIESQIGPELAAVTA